MNKFFLKLFLSSLVFTSIAHADEYVVCAAKTAPVYMFNLSHKYFFNSRKIAFNAKNLAPVIQFQSFGPHKLIVKYQANQPFYFFNSEEVSAESSSFYSPSLIRIIFNKGKEVDYVRVQFPDRPDKNNVGWIESSLIKRKSECGIITQPSVADYFTIFDFVNEILFDPEIKSDEYDTDQTIRSLDDKNCCIFPLKTYAKESYTEGIRKFGSTRSKGYRVHAAVDLYQAQYHPVYAVADGEILADRVPFYLGTSATEIKHTGGFIVRYGEIASYRQKPLKLDSTVKAGQLIGYIKKVNARSVHSPMLHFELYSGEGKGSLTTKGGKYQRRSDLLDPTPYLKKWEAKLR